MMFSSNHEEIGGDLKQSDLVIAADGYDHGLAAQRRRFVMRHAQSAWNATKIRFVYLIYYNNSGCISCIVRASLRAPNWPDVVEAKFQTELQVHVCWVQLQHLFQNYKPVL